jgi:hypothetical protein
MINNDLTNNCPQELELWIDNDEYFYRQWRHSILTGKMDNIKDAFEEAGFKYRDDQWEHLVDLFEEAMADRAEEESPGVHF